MRARCLASFFIYLAILLIAGCAISKRADGLNSSNISFWQGRLAVHAEPDESRDQAQAQAFSAAFELRGNAKTGELLLLTPLGSTAAAIRWTPNGAELQAQGSTRQFGNLQQLILQTLGSDVPVSALFLWLRGQDVEVDGWQVDLSQSGQGKIVASRQQPPPAAQLRLILEQ
ncbi:MAG: outer membrane lipoprotein LolB [Rhodoferax sp.]|nr:outer membrane lipoprotein LolB [Rhodoferax sp.]NCP54628.1 outer membrane lipoprotein LolB [Rhodoferax sp.]OIP19754.1 MAG: hypothetical protein AUK52_11925 [Comamonadaceae bacterium CG2_30_60_41]PIW07361.1 MAG: hypothetical protein COW39_13640 [Comamonadaceae bacterium CG17_big_fil_post_rev_8_21_14_2_50_60_13]PIY26332.1 MAG: hypothetical protein COZ10_02760 [Comamonadaceae bacterium CG_4_10_14_3_um_filter_60_75]